MPNFEFWLSGTAFWGSGRILIYIGACPDRRQAASSVLAGNLATTNFMRGALVCYGTI
jgi:hypothetical protein